MYLLDPAEGEANISYNMSQNDSPCLSDFWNLETIRICDPINVKDDDRALNKFNLMMLSYQVILILPLEE